MHALDHSRILVVGGAGFVGSSLVKELIGTSSAYILIVDDLRCAERFSVPLSTRVDFIDGDFNSEHVRRRLPANFNYVFHLSPRPDDTLATIERGANRGRAIIQVRFENVYGPGEILGAGRHATSETLWRNSIPSFIYHALKKMPLQVSDSGEKRKFSYVRDVVRGLMQCAVNGDAGKTYNLTGDEEMTMRDLARLINELASNPIAVEPIRNVGRVDLRDGLKQTIQWTRVNLSLIERCIAKHELARPLAA
jgi:nucleoside-diphosphate-sugar epimerase